MGPLLPVLAIAVFVFTSKHVQAIWCFVCDTSFDNKCDDPKDSFFQDPKDLMNYLNDTRNSPFPDYIAERVFAFTAASYIDNTTHPDTPKVKYYEERAAHLHCPPDDPASQAQSYVLQDGPACVDQNSNNDVCWTKQPVVTETPSFADCFRPRDLRLMDCDYFFMPTADSPEVTTRCQKIVQTVGMDGEEPVKNIIRRCTAAPLQQTCKRQISNDGLVDVTQCVCNYDACNEGRKSSTISFSSLAHAVILAIALRR